MAALREAIPGDDLNRIRERTHTLSQALSRSGEASHRAAAAQPGEQASAGGPASAGGYDVVDAAFEDVDQRRHG